jgi:hypothetical protein
MLSSELELVFENLATIGRIGVEEEDVRPSTVMAVGDDAKMEDLVGEEAPAISMDLEWYKCSKKRAMVDLDLVVRVAHLNIVAKFRRRRPSLSRHNFAVACELVPSPSMAPQGCHIVAFRRDKGGSAETVDLAVPPRIGPELL